MLVGVVRPVQLFCVDQVRGARINAGRPRSRTRHLRTCRFSVSLGHARIALEVVYRSRGGGG